MRACVDKSLCIGCGLCAGLEPSVFKMDDDGLAVAYQDAKEDVEENVREAIDGCPVGAITEE